MAKIVLLVDGQPGEEVSLGDGAVRLGREAGNDMVLDDEPLVSPHHATLHEENTRWHVRDEDSRYGTFVNGRRILEQGLKDGDVVELGLGGPILRFESEEGEREKGMATTAGRLKQYYEEHGDEGAEEPLEGAGKLAVPTTVRGLLVGLVVVAAAGLGAWFLMDRDDPLGGGEAQPASPVAPGGVLGRAASVALVDND